MNKKLGNQQNMGEALNEFIQKNKLQKGIDKVEVREVWSRVMGSGVSTYTTAVELQRDVLLVSLSSSVLRQELSQGTSKIINMLNEELGKELIKKLVLR